MNTSEMSVLPRLVVLALPALEKAPVLAGRRHLLAVRVEKQLPAQQLELISVLELAQVYGKGHTIFREGMKVPGQEEREEAEAEWMRGEFDPCGDLVVTGMRLGMMRAPFARRLMRRSWRCVRPWPLPSSFQSRAPRLSFACPISGMGSHRRGLISRMASHRRELISGMA